MPDPALREKQDGELADLPEDLKEGLQFGATASVFRLEGDLADIPFGRIAAAALAGFLWNIDPKWALSTRDGRTIPVQALAMAVEGWAARIAEADDRRGT